MLFEVSLIYVLLVANVTLIVPKTNIMLYYAGSMSKTRPEILSMNAMGIDDYCVHILGFTIPYEKSKPDDFKTKI